MGNLRALALIVITHRLVEFFATFKLFEYR